MEKELFTAIRAALCQQHVDVTEGRMMSSPAIHYKGKVFAFLSTKQNMVFKFKNTELLTNYGIPATVFSPFKTKKPLTGWYEVTYQNHQRWKILSEEALALAKNN
ncbi:hypothetical protein [uncultured Croceitalea sp.]|uniref:hypothetical protein n=1 Tax=uncultured Croceitalea sp. TaxID=1798908 RepID=UPI003305D60B